MFLCNGHQFLANADIAFTQHIHALKDKPKLQKREIDDDREFSFGKGKYFVGTWCIYYLNSMRTCNLDIRRYLVIVLGMKKHHKMFGPHSECQMKKNHRKRLYIASHIFLSHPVFFENRSIFRSPYFYSHARNCLFGYASIFSNIDLFPHS